MAGLGPIRRPHLFNWPLTIDIAKQGPMVTLNNGDHANYLEFYKDSYNPRVAVGALGNIEANLSYNMDYKTSVHKYYDSTTNALWIALNADGIYLQYAQSGLSTAGDIWDEAGNPYLWQVDTSGNETVMGSLTFGSTATTIADDGVQGRVKLTGRWRSYNSTLTAPAFEALYTGGSDTKGRWYVDAQGKQHWSFNGTSYGNANLYAASADQLQMDGPLQTAGLLVSGDPTAAASTVGLGSTTGVGNGTSTNLTALAQGTGSGPATLAVNTWIRATVGATSGWIPFFV